MDGWKDGALAGADVAQPAVGGKSGMVVLSPNHHHGPNCHHGTVMQAGAILLSRRRALGHRLRGVKPRTPTPPLSATLALPDLAATEALAAALAGHARAGDALFLEGPLGAGKTAFARAFLRAISGEPDLEVPSPSFNLVLPYATRAGEAVHHFDLYRLSGPEEVPELGWDEAREGVVLVEWAERLGAMAAEIPAAVLLTLRFIPQDEERRVVVVQGWPGRRLAEALAGFAPASGPVSNVEPS